MRARVLIRSLLGLAAVAAGVTLTITAGSAQPGPPPASAPKAAAQVDAGPQPPPAALAAQVRNAAPGHELGKGPSLSVDEVATAGAKAPAVRLTISGTFPIRDLDPTVLVDNTPVGRGITAADARSLRVAVGDPSVLKTGAVVAYRYGTGPVTVVGALTKGVK